MDIRETFADKLKELRTNKKLSQTELAEKLGVSRGSISFYENGERTADIDFVYKAAQFFNVSADYLLGLSPNPTTDPEIKAICNYTGLSDEAVKKLNTMHELSEEGVNEEGPYAIIGEQFKLSLISDVIAQLRFLNSEILTTNDNMFDVCFSHMQEYIGHLEKSEKCAREALDVIDTNANISNDIFFYRIGLSDLKIPHSKGFKEVVKSDEQYKIAMAEYYQAIESFKHCINTFYAEKIMSCDIIRNNLESKIRKIKSAFFKVGDTDGNDK